MDLSAKTLLKSILLNDIRDKVCRVCFEKCCSNQNYLSDVFSFHFGSSQQISLKTVLEMMTGLQVETNTCLPQVICETCKEKLLSYFIFREKYIQVQKTLGSCMEYFLLTLNDLKPTNNLKTKEMFIHFKYEKLGKYVEKLHTRKIKKKILHEADTIKTELPEYAELQDNDVDKTFESSSTFLRIGNKNFRKSTFLGKSFSCRFCCGKYATAYLARLHTKRIHGKITFICGECGVHFDSREDLKNHGDVQHSGFTQLCQRCGMSVSKKFLEKHLRMCINFKPEQQRFICDDCNRSWKTKAQLYSHIYGNHLYVKPFRCKICKKGFSTNANLKGHAVVHTRERRWSCETCLKKFVDKKALKLHIRLHTGEKPYPCSECDERFVDSSRRTAHMQKKHMDKNFSCPICDMRFYTKSTMTAHRRKVHEKQKNKLKIDNNLVSKNIQTGGEIIC